MLPTGHFRSSDQEAGFRIFHSSVLSVMSTRLPDWIAPDWQALQVVHIDPLPTSHWVMSSLRRVGNHELIILKGNMNGIPVFIRARFDFMFIHPEDISRFYAGTESARPTSEESPVLSVMSTRSPDWQALHVLTIKPLPNSIWGVSSLSRVDNHEQMILQGYMNGIPIFMRAKFDFTFIRPEDINRFQTETESSRPTSEELHEQ
jgi:hypothetical protein